MSGRSSGRRRSRWIVVAAILFIFIALAVLVPHFVGESRLSSAAQAWDDAGLSLDDYLTERPARPANASALEIERLAAAVGIDIVPKSSDRPRPDAEPRVREAYSQAKGWLAEAFAGESQDPPAPPEDLRTWFSENEAGWSALRARLAAGGPLEWDEDVSLGWEAPISNLLGYMRIGTLLHADALVAARAGRAADAEQALEASWTLSESLADSPHLICGLIRLALARDQAAALRRLPAIDAEAWSSRLRGRDAVADIGSAFRGEAASTFQSYRIGSLRAASGGGGVGSRLSWFILGGDGIATYLDSLKPLAEFPETAAGCPELPMLERWEAELDGIKNPVARVMLPNLLNALSRAWMAQYQDELTVRVLDVRSADGDVPESWKLSACDEVAFELEEMSGGALRLAPLGDLPAEVQARVTTMRQKPAALTFVLPPG